MKGLFAGLWKDDSGALIATEYLFAGTTLVIGIIVGLAGFRDAVNAELSKLGNAILCVSQEYTISGMTGCSSSTDGSEALDTPATVTNPTATPPSSPAVIDVPVG